MANDLTQDPLVLNTADGSAVVIGGNRFVFGILAVFSGAGTAQLQVKSSTKPWWGAGAAGANTFWTPIRSLTPGDLILPTATNVTLYVYLGPER